MASGDQTKKDFIQNRFKALVRDHVRISGVWHAGNHPHQGEGGSAGVVLDYGAAGLGPQHEPEIPSNSSETQSLDTGLQVGPTLFNVLHGFAMRLTRIRLGRSYFSHSPDSGGTQCYMDDGLQIAALDPKLALYFPLPSRTTRLTDLTNADEESVYNPDNQPLQGESLRAQELDIFLENLRTRVIQLQQGRLQSYTMVSCHANCHSSCHRSRSRR